jgi:hypothetical protein
VRDTVTDQHFIDNLKKALAIMRPMDGLIIKYQSDKVLISEVMSDFHALSNEFAKLHSTNVITKQEAEYMVMLMKKRFQFMYGEAHGLSYLLNPVLLGEGLPGPNRRTLEDTLINTPIDDVAPIDEQRQEKIYMDYIEFLIQARQEKKNNSFQFQLLTKRKKSPLEWWFTDGTHYPTLQKIAMKLFTMATSLATSERNFSTMGFIHSKLRNALATRTVEKLVFIKSNLSAFYNYLAPDDDVVKYIRKSNDDAAAALNDSTPEDAMEFDDEDVVSM